MTLLADMVNGPISEDFLGLFAMAACGLVALVAIVGGFIRGAIRVRAREQTKRELAAYVAEGTMKPEDAERIIRADMPKWERA